MSNHTPGPWSFHHVSRPNGSEFLIEDDSEQTPVAYVQLPVTPAGLANAQLIAAAPDLLAACRALMLPKSKREREEAEELAKEAIAKAEGRS